jgi:hypothetical protein
MAHSRRVTVGLLLAVAPIACETAAAPPTLAGYRLGVTWSATARDAPCTTDVPKTSALPRVPFRTCHVSDSVRLVFVRDTLVLVYLQPTWTPPHRVSDKSDSTSQPSAQGEWRDHLRTPLVAQLGQPDSVQTSSHIWSGELGGWCERIIAEWGRGATREWSGIAVLASSGWPDATGGGLHIADVWVYRAPADLPQTIRALLAADRDSIKDQCTLFE